MRNWWRAFFVLLFLSGSPQLFTSQPVFADELAEILREKGVITKEDWTRVQAEEEMKAEEQKKRLEEEFPVKIGYGSKGLEFATRDGKYLTQIQWRFQGRYSYPYDSDPRSVSDFDEPDESTFRVRRARIKVGGHGYQPWVKYYFEYDWPSSRLLDWRLDLTKYKWLQLRVGQWKINLNRERVDSSGKQQFVERSIVNRQFTIDRQQGAQLMGQVLPGTWADSWYYAGVYTGTGRGEDSNDDKNMMYMARYQWNFLGRDLKWSQSDVEYHEKPTGSIAFGAMTNIGECTRFSSSGCGSLDGFLPTSGAGAAANDQYRLRQMVEEFAFKWRGLSLQHEFHWKEVKDRKGGGNPNGQEIQNMMGAYAQGGYFPHYLISAIPKPLEVAFRYGFVDPDTGTNNDAWYEYTLGVNWFFAGHRNKLTFDTTRNEVARPGDKRTEQRFRLQWDVSF